MPSPDETDILKVYMEYPWQCKEMFYLPKFQTGKHSNYTNDILGLLSTKMIGILLFGLLKMRTVLVDNSDP